MTEIRSLSEDRSPTFRTLHALGMLS